jgi:hypothetical protein
LLFSLENINTIATFPKPFFAKKKFALFGRRPFFQFATLLPPGRAERRANAKRMIILLFKLL